MKPPQKTDIRQLHRDHDHVTCYYYLSPEKLEQHSAILSYAIINYFLNSKTKTYTLSMQLELRLCMVPFSVAIWLPEVL